MNPRYGTPVAHGQAETQTPLKRRALWHTKTSRILFDLVEILPHSIRPPPAPGDVEAMPNALQQRILGVVEVIRGFSEPFKGASGGSIGALAVRLPSVGRRGTSCRAAANCSFSRFSAASFCWISTSFVATAYKPQMAAIPPHGTAPAGLGKAAAAFRQELPFVNCGPSPCPFAQK